MNSADLVRIARQRAGLTQAELAARSGVSRETIARWESGSREPTLASLRDLATAAGLELSVGLAEGDESLDELTRDQLRLAPLARLRALLAKPDADAAHTALRWLADADAPTIVIGAIAGALRGAPQRPPSAAVEVVAADPEHFVERMLDAGLDPVDSPERWAASDRRWPWALPGGSEIVLASRLPGSNDYKDLRRGAGPVDLGRGRRVDVAHSRDLVRLAEASPRPDDRARLPGLRSLLALSSERDEP